MEGDLHPLKTLMAFFHTKPDRVKLNGAVEEAVFAFPLQIVLPRSGWRKQKWGDVMSFNT